ncbi:hypothetical protein GCM10023322_80420 [Rugosimonospora acidiphila]|uniref:DUF4352 domain-containing protein n=1 Tax=Rugosimonospora acidiphila TaxID=556531 RepID=A0ABP9SR02_9ACTN
MATGWGADPPDEHRSDEHRPDEHRSDEHRPEDDGFIDLSVERGDDRPAARRRSVLPGVRRSRLAGLVAIALVVGGLAGYLVGLRQATLPTAAPSPSASPPQLAATGDRCATQIGNQLQLGIEVVNESRDNLMLRQVAPYLPLGMLREVDSGWGGCGDLSPRPSSMPYLLQLGAATWLTVTFDVLESCPGAAPVGFQVFYEQSGREGELQWLAFPDLGDVSYGRCSTGPG